MKILITGASGFIGSFIVEESLRRGMETWAAVRKTSSHRYLKDKRINFIELDFSSKEKLKEQLQGHDFDYVVHAAGATKCLHKEDFFRINTEGTKNFVSAIRELQMPLKRFVYVSSLSIYGAIREEQPYTEIKESDTPKPNTAYGESKLAAERYLDEQNEGLSEEDKFPFVVLRPTGVYGPREKDYMMMVESIAGHSDFAVGFKQQDITFVYVTDVVQAVFLAIEKGKTGRKYFLSDGEVYQSCTFSNLIHEELGRPWWIRIPAPIWVLKIVTFFGDKLGHLTGKVTALNNDKYNILKQRNWRCDIEPARKELGYNPQVKLEEGVKKTVAWYKENKKD
jgi:nucleoside-diphosphate-sugar epimerase